MKGGNILLAALCSLFNCAAFATSESFDVGVDLGSLVSRDYAERGPFKFDGKIGTVKLELK